MTKLHYLSMRNPDKLDLCNLPKPIQARLRKLDHKDIQLWRNGKWGERRSAPGSPLVSDCAYRVNPACEPKRLPKECLERNYS